MKASLWRAEESSRSELILKMPLKERTQDMQQLFLKARCDPQIFRGWGSGLFCEWWAGWGWSFLPPRWLPRKWWWCYAGWPAAASMRGWDLQEGYSLDLGKSTQTHQYSSFLGWARRLLKNVARGLLEIESVSCIFSGRLISKLSTVGHKAMPSQFTVTNKAMPSRLATWLDVFESRPVKSLSCLFKDPYVYQMWKNTHMWWENLCCSI